MKKLFAAITIVAASYSFYSCTMGSGSGLLAGNSSTTTSGLASGAAGTALSSIGNLVNSFLGGTAVSQQNLIGTWTYKGPNVAFESSNFLAKAGGAVAASSIENQLDTQLQKFGLKPGACTFTFNSDNTFSANLNGRTISGTYTYDPSTRKLTMSGGMGLINLTATVGNTLTGISLLFQADKLLGLLTSAGSLLGNVSSGLSTISGLLNNYNGMQIGLELTR